jgi:SAM-dependent methyltransferase
MKKISEIYDNLFGDEDHLDLIDIVVNEKLKKIKSLLDGFEGSVLDVACGSCWTTSLFEKNSVKLYGIDECDNALEIAKSKNYIAKKVDLNEEKIPYEADFFDLALCIDIIEHTIYPENILQEVKRVLRKGGHVIVSVPNIASWFNRLLLLFGFYPWSVESTGIMELGDVFYHATSGHMRTYTKKSINSLLRRLGFEISACVGTSISIGQAYEKFYKDNIKVGAEFRKNFWFPPSLLKPIDLLGTLISNYPGLATEIIVKARKI